MWHTGWCGNMAQGNEGQYGIGDGVVLQLRGLQGNMEWEMVW